MLLVAVSATPMPSPLHVRMESRQSFLFPLHVGMESRQNFLLGHHVRMESRQSPSHMRMESRQRLVSSLRMEQSHAMNHQCSRTFLYYLLILWWVEQRVWLIQQSQWVEQRVWLVLRVRRSWMKISADQRKDIGLQGVWPIP